MDSDTKVDWKKYLLVFFITLTIFLIATFLASTINKKKIGELEDITNEIALNVLASETQFALLEELRCQDVTSAIISDELNTLATRLEDGSATIEDGTKSTEYIKNYYFLLEIKDYLLIQKARERCKLDVIPIIYFYGNSDECPLCTKQSIALTEVRSKSEKARVYSFDYDSDLSAVETFIKINKVPKELPALIIDNKVYTGYKTIEDLEKIIPKLLPEETVGVTKEN
jgi:hypothetical protein